MKLNEIDFDILSDKELVGICLKYKLIKYEEISRYKRTDILAIIKKWLHNKMINYGQNKKNVKAVSVNRRMSVPGNIQKNNISRQKISNTPPNVQKQRRMSHPITIIEKKEAVETHERNIIKEKAVNSIHEGLKNRNPKYDLIGMYPPVPKLVAIGDLHGDIMITLSVLKLAEVIPQTSTINNINGIHWSGGSTWVIQLGDQIDRCRPEDWDKNCIKDYDDVYEDEGNNMVIIGLLIRLDTEARKYGGRILGLLGNHELMNIDKDFRYVSPKEFLEFVPEKDKLKVKTNDGYPNGYYHRTKAFERGGNISKLYASKKKSIIVVGSFIFVHGGLSIDLVSKYKLSEINDIVSKWMIKESSNTEEKIFDEIFRDDDDMSPFWCRIYGEDDDNDNNEKSFNELLRIINKQNKLLQPVKGMVIAHTPQFMEGKYLNSIYNNRLWRIDVGMSRAFGKHDECQDDKYRQPQILIIHNDQKFETRKKPFNSERHPSTGMGNKIDLDKEIMF
tara:strand:- start:229 stop:1740 length:1512 start_codon:yes stop_codon:yes gene_type:complete